MARNPLGRCTSSASLPSRSCRDAIRCQIGKPAGAIMVSSVTSGTTLDPLPPVLRHGLIAVAFFGILSLICSVSLFTFLTYRLCVWHHKGLLKDGANQFLLLIYNLIFADIQQAMAFALTSVYISQDKIEVGTTTCWANGWFVSTGDLALEYSSLPSHCTPTTPRLKVGGWAKKCFMAGSPARGRSCT